MSALFPHLVCKLSARFPHRIRKWSTLCPPDSQTMSASYPHRVRWLSTRCPRHVRELSTLDVDRCCARHTAFTNYAHTSARTLWTGCALALTTMMYVDKTVFANHNVCGQKCFGNHNVCGQTCLGDSNVGPACPKFRPTLKTCLRPPKKKNLEVV